MDNEKLIEEMARGIAEAILSQDMNDGPLPEGWGMKVSWLDQGETDFAPVAQAALAAHNAAIEAAGFMVVPVEPTEAMVSAADDLPDWCS